MKVNALKIKDHLMRLATPAGLEPATCRLEGGCSIQLSYGVGCDSVQAATFLNETNNLNSALNVDYKVGANGSIGQGGSI